MLIVHEFLPLVPRGSRVFDVQKPAADIFSLFMFVGVPAIRVGVHMLVGVGGGVHLNPAVLKGVDRIGDLRQEIEFVGDDDIADI